MKRVRWGSESIPGIHVNRVIYPFDHYKPPKCPDCGGLLDFDAKECPHCGIALVKKKRPPAEKLSKGMQVVMYLFLLALFVTFVVLFVQWQRGVFSKDAYSILQALRSQ